MPGRRLPDSWGQETGFGEIVNNEVREGCRAVELKNEKSHQTPILHYRKSSQGFL